MSKRELIRSEIDNVPEDRLDELYSLIKRFREAQAARPKPGILAKLRAIAITAPPDFAADLDLYLSGVKRVDEDVS